MSDASPESNTHVFTLTMDWLAFTLPDVSAQEVMRQIGGELSLADHLGRGTTVELKIRTQPGRKGPALPGRTPP